MPYRLATPQIAESYFNDSEQTRQVDFGFFARSLAPKRAPIVLANDWRLGRMADGDNLQLAPMLLRFSGSGARFSFWSDSAFARHATLTVCEAYDLPDCLSNSS